MGVDHAAVRIGDGKTNFLCPASKGGYHDLALKVVTEINGVRTECRSCIEALPKGALYGAALLDGQDIAVPSVSKTVDHVDNKWTAVGRCTYRCGEIDRSHEQGGVAVGTDLGHIVVVARRSHQTGNGSGVICHNARCAGSLSESSGAVFDQPIGGSAIASRPEGVGLCGANIGHTGQRGLRAGRYFIHTDVVQRHVPGEACATDSSESNDDAARISSQRNGGLYPRITAGTLLLSGDRPQAIVPDAVVPHIHTHAAHSGAIHMVEKAELRVGQSREVVFGRERIG
ncbi:MAG: Uncharacterised protein [Flavobacteriia bacterium]|nr:MAG: Uncharacterised protein [Flavobacteriia bacterium]